MSRRNRSSSGFTSDNYWQSADWNMRGFQMYRDWIVTLAISRYKWLNLPETCDERFLETTLLRQGVATISAPKSMPGTFFSTQVAQSGRFNVYDTPSSWESIGNNGWRFHASPRTGTLVWDSRLRIPKWSQIEFFARRLAAIDRVQDINLSQQRTPYLLTAPRECKNDLIQVYKQLAGNEPAILGKPELLQNVNIDAVNTNVPFLGNELAAQKQNLWKEVYDFLGIRSVNAKAERMVEAEVDESSEPTDMMALDGLNSRRDAARWLNDHFGTDIHVVWREDNESDNWKYLTSAREQAETEGGADDGGMVRADED